MHESSEFSIIEQKHSIISTIISYNIDFLNQDDTF